MANELPKVVLDAQAKGKTILELTGEDDKKYYFEKPNREDINKFIATATKGKPAQAVRNLVIEKAIHPPGAELANEFNENPGKMVPINSALQAAVGMNEEYIAKKL